MKPPDNPEDVEKAVRKEPMGMVFVDSSP